MIYNNFMNYKKFIIPVIATLISFGAIAYASQPTLNSSQEGATPVNGYYLETNGVNSTWAAGGGGTTSTTTTRIWIDSNRTDSYTADGSIFHPYKTIGAAIQTVPATYEIEANRTGAPYVESPMTFTATSTIDGNQAAIVVTASGNITFNTGTVLNNVNIVSGNVIFADTSLYDPDVLSNSFIQGNVVAYGLTEMTGGELTGGTLYTEPNSLTNFVGVDILDTVGDAGTMNLNDVNIQPTVAGYAVTASTTGSVLDMSGVSLENLNANGGGVSCQNGATTNYNNFSSMALIVGTTTNAGAINCGTSATSLGTYSAYSSSNGARLYGVVNNLVPDSFAGLSIEGNTLLNVVSGYTGIATATPATALDVNGNITDESVLSANCLKTNGAGEILATSCGGGGGSGTVSTSTSETAGYFPRWTSTSGTPALLSGTSGIYTNSFNDISIATTSDQGAFSVGVTGGVANPLGLAFSVASTTANAAIAQFINPITGAATFTASSTYASFASGIPVGIGVSTPINQLDESGAMTGGSYGGLYTPPTNGFMWGGNVSLSTTTSSAILNLGNDAAAANGTTTVMMGKIQFDGYNSAGTRTCVYVVGTTLTAVAGACIQ